MGRSFGYRIAQLTSMCLALLLVGALIVILLNILGHVAGLARFAAFLAAN